MWQPRARVVGQAISAVPLPLLRFVLQFADALATGRVVTNRACECHNRAALGQYGPRVGVRDRKLLAHETYPHIA